MQRTILFFVIFYFVITLIDCSRQTKEGVYVSERHRPDYLEIKSNGSFYLKEKKNEVVGKYEIDATSLTLIFEGGKAARGRLSGDTLIDKDGEMWILWHGGKKRSSI
jgi:hypothetical protein